MELNRFLEAPFVEIGITVAVVAKRAEASHVLGTYLGAFDTAGQFPINAICSGGIPGLLPVLEEQRF